MICNFCDEEISQEEAEIARVMDLAVDYDPASNTVTTKRIQMHHECFLRGIFGSVGHQKGTCHCFVKGSGVGDPPGMSLRQAAIEATALAFQRFASPPGGVH